MFMLFSKPKFTLKQNLIGCVVAFVLIATVFPFKWIYAKTFVSAFYLIKITIIPSILTSIFLFRKKLKNVMRFWLDWIMGMFLSIVYFLLFYSTVFMLINFIPNSKENVSEYYTVVARYRESDRRGRSTGNYLCEVKDGSERITVGCNNLSNIYGDDEIRITTRDGLLGTKVIVHVQ